MKPTDEDPVMLETPTSEVRIKNGQRQCTFYIEKKKRHCRVGVLRDYDYCAEHATNQEQHEDFRRIKCPYDGSHTCYEKMLDDHLKRCNSRPKEPQPYFCAHLNSDEPQEDPNFVEVKLADMGTDELSVLIDTIRRIHSEQLPIINESYGFHPTMASEMLRTDVGESVMKHLVQNSSLLSLIEGSGLAAESTCFIEFGSGKGGLSYYIAKAWGDAQCQCLLLDRQSHRHKRDNKLKDSGYQINRIRIDIEHLKLDKISNVEDARTIVGVAKHLCGSATDMALKCLLGTNSASEKVAGLVMASCCHHRCTWEGYVGKKYFEMWGLERKYFKCLTGIAGWAVCGTGRTKFEDSATGLEEVIGNPRYAALNLNTEARRKIGLQVKELIDFGRACYTESFGLQAKLCHYVDAVTTLENVAIVGSRS